MAAGEYTRLSDVYVPEIVNPILFREAISQSKVIASDAVQINADMSANMTGNGLIFTSPAYVNIADNALPALIPNDDPDDLGEPKKLYSGSHMYHRLARNNGWAVMDVVADITGNDPMQQVLRQYGGAVAKVREASLMSILKAVMTESIAGALHESIAAEVVGSQTAATKFNPEALIDLLVAAGSDTFDGGEGWSMFVSPTTLGYMLKSDLIDGQKISSQGLTLNTYMGIKVVPTKIAPTRAGTTSGVVQTSYLVRDGAIKMGVGQAKEPTEVERKPSIGNSGGGEIFWVRDVFGYSLDGFSYTGTPSATLADTALATTANWTKVLSDSQVGIVALDHN